jgi:hypothetical protein
MIFYDFYEKNINDLPSGLQKASAAKTTKTVAAVFPRGSKKRKSNNDDKHDYCQEKRRASTLC